MRKFITTVTVTGADDLTNIDEMFALQEEFPFVEWGILLSYRAQGQQKRFPSLDWIYNAMTKIQFDYSSKFNLSGHLCGDLVNDFLEEDIMNLLYKSMDDSYPKKITSKKEHLELCANWVNFNRIQINTHGTRHKFNKENLNSNIRMCGSQIIFQYDQINKILEEIINDHKVNDVAALHDCSHGMGILPSEWPKPLDCFTGYAGGLSPDNVKYVCEHLSHIVPENRSIWIDAETHLRTNEYFDLDKVRQFLLNTKDFIVDDQE